MVYYTSITYYLTSSCQLQQYNKLLEMDENCCQLLNKFVKDVSERDFQEMLKRAEQSYNVREFKISMINPALASQLYHSIYIKFKRNKESKGELNWWENELRVFIWIVVCYLQINNTRIEELDSKDWQFFSRLFPHKQIILFQYQSINLLKDHSAAKKWTQEEDQLFGSLIKEKDQKYKWSQLAKQLYISSNKQFFRTPKQCRYLDWINSGTPLITQVLLSQLRERWLNHLDPSKSKKEWQLKEDYVLITHVRNKGKKWAEISKLLRNRRNEHSIKNRFKSLLTKEEKLHPEQLPQTVLIQNIFKKYEHHFSKIKGLSSSQQVKYEVQDEQDDGEFRDGNDNDNYGNDIGNLTGNQAGNLIGNLTGHQAGNLTGNNNYQAAIGKQHLFQIHSNPNFSGCTQQQQQEMRHPVEQQQQTDPLPQDIRFHPHSSDEDPDDDYHYQRMFQEDNQQRDAGISSNPPHYAHYYQPTSEQKQYEFLKAKEMQIRAEFMVSDDPFIFLKEYFKCKDM